MGQAAAGHFGLDLLLGCSKVGRYLLALPLCARCPCRARLQHSYLLEMKTWELCISAGAVTPRLGLRLSELTHISSLQPAQLQRPSAEALLPHKPPMIARSAGLRRIDQSVTMQFMLFGAIDSFLPSLRYSEVCCVVFLFSRSHAQKAKYK